MKVLEQRAIGCLAGAAVGDALGGATEGRSPEQIKARYGGYVTGIVGPFLPDWQTARPMSPYHKGDGHITDDTLMTNTIVKVYEAKRDHLDAYDMADLLVPLLMNEKVWIPELEKETVALNRIFLAEKWLVHRLHYAHVDPREAGNGNVVNCGAAMYMAPVGIANATNPRGAYAEAIEVAGAHQLSYGREAAGVFAAAVAEAMRPGAGVDDVIQAALSVARDGTRAAIEVVAKAATTVDDWQSAIGVLREAVVPFDTVGPNYREPGLGGRRPSRLHAIEELPIALGMVIVARGNYTDAVLGAVNYGRDSDSIATMAGAICGALHGIEAIPEEWRDVVGRNSRLDLTATGRSMAEIAVEIRAKDRVRHEAYEAAFAELEVAGA
ncbi:ADP-ribosylglycohydrolase family protein [Micromonospora sp. NPDC023966]|uniref:ADP-ribosylglycohydrolase family protein n=1 Tax=Micromonospora sp. NPDC023966 TaxID=3154699 RepID=UPI0033D3DC9F